MLRSQAPSDTPSLATMRTYAKLRIYSYCTNPLMDEDLHAWLRDMKFDILVTDGIPLSRCFYALAYKLNIPYVTLSTHIEPWLARTPSLPSFVAFSPGGLFPADMTLWQRICNTWNLLSWSAAPDVETTDDAVIAEYVPEKPFVTLTYLAGQSLLWMYNTDPLLDPPGPLMSNAIFTGGLTTHPARPLPPDLEEFVNGAKDGLVVVSFGSTWTHFPLEYVDVLARAFAKLPPNLRLVWKVLDPVPVEMPPNVKIMSWMPQNDLVGHKKTQVFVTHCGSNSQMEGLYHGVPMLGIPLATDQKHNSAGMVARGYGIEMRLGTFKPEQLLEAINTLLTNNTFADNVRKASRIYRSRRMSPRVHLSFWLEHVIKHGGSHLHSNALYLPWYEYIMLDILFAVLMFLLTPLLFFKVARKLL